MSNETKREKWTPESATDVVSNEDKFGATQSCSYLEPTNGSTVQPTTFMNEEKKNDKIGKIAWGKTYYEGALVNTVILGTEAAMINRHEEGLLRAIQDHEQPGSWKVCVPRIGIDYVGTSLEEVMHGEELSTLTIPHRVVDQNLLSSELIDEHNNHTIFRNTPVGKACLRANEKMATALYFHDPASLLFGACKMGDNIKIASCMQSELLGLNAVPTAASSSCSDRFHISSKLVIYESEDKSEGWVDTPEAAKKNKNGKPKIIKPSEQNLGATPPVINTTSRVAINIARHCLTNSLGILRRLSFPVYPDGTMVPASQRKAVNDAVRTVLFAMALVSIRYQRRIGYALKTNTTLLPLDHPDITFEVRDLLTGQMHYFHVGTPEESFELLMAVYEKAKNLGFPWRETPLLYRPTEKLQNAVTKSLKKVGGDEEDTENDSEDHDEDQE